MTDSNLTRFALVKEATRNTTPSNPIFQIMRATGVTLTDNNQTVVSDEIRSDRMSGPEIGSVIEVMLGRQSHGMVGQNH